MSIFSYFLYSLNLANNSYLVMIVEKVIIRVDPVEINKHFNSIKLLVENMELRFKLGKK